ncbi:MAG: amidohydrolase [Bacteroidales bacterium]|nr:amidohydrolase [Bacteroidales bacterium]
MESLLIKNVLHEGVKTNIYIEGNRISAIGVPADKEASRVIEAEGKAILPAFYNTHTHAAMSLLRGYADDMPLQEWLTEWIWPFEDKMTADDVKRGTVLAAEEMVKGGTVFFSDMYFAPDKIAEAVDAAGMRAAIGVTVMENHSYAEREAKSRFIENWNDRTGRMSLTVAPHAIYTVGTERLKEAAAKARDNGLKLHIHVSETTKEVEDCIAAHGMSPVRYLDSIGFLGPDVIAAHCVYVDKEEWDILAERGVTVAHCPCSNMKLGSGRFPYELAIASGARITLGTDGASSNNNLDMREEMKFAALLAKLNGDPSLLPATEVLKWATVNGAEAFGIDAGVIAEGKLADCILLNLNDVTMRPLHNLVSNWVYSAQANVVDTVICDGKVIYG